MEIETSGSKTRGHCHKINLRGGGLIIVVGKKKKTNSAAQNYFRLFRLFSDLFL